ncbi:MutS-related protein [Ruminiclostridium cellulolyticum]|uniref:DNA mismatch repair protein MutS domain protein n=1 Tax=Ruminiclostridium cellulolyticum (strain ATCC 35319 / DSM 5812 / JCM 6584 / H10) TaxID=394503 RepID=B8I6P2_RUMCH|nr:DNA mismatch repair protein MutS [Ruminiclostridium cellulolyticum]ACL74934.1 DNA mismatch repair protein MutS domain protein [Ruminiclostridium cellulolyticum H10]
MKFFYIILAITAGCIILSIIGKISRTNKNRKQIRAQWGKAPVTKYTADIYNSVRNYFDNNKDQGESFFIDDITWNDLDMNRIFSRLNITCTDVGEEYLYNILRELLYDQNELTERDRLIEYFRTNPSQREKIQLILSGLGKLRYLSISEYINGKRSGGGIKSIYYKILSLIFIASIFATIFYPGAIAIFLISLAVNVVVYFKARDQIVGHLQSLGYIVNMLGISRRISKLNIKELNTYLNELKKCTAKVKGISVNAFYFLFYTSENYLFELIKIFLLGEPIAFHSIFKIVNKYRHEIDSVYRTIGLLDSLISVASYRESLDYFTTPVLTKDNINNKKIEFTDMYHPLIKNPVTNSFSVTGGALITGSNASGKSTFLKSVAINAIFAQTIFTCLAKDYYSSYFNIYSSMALSDNLEMNESYYIVEIKSLKRILKGLNDHVPCFCVIDEVLRGTNTIERIAASSEIMNFITDNNCICLCASHDIELTQILADKVENYHFQEFFEDDNIKFDYKIYPGKSTTRNAIKLLKILGYDESIVDNAEQRACQFNQNGYWSKV